MKFSIKLSIIVVHYNEPKALFDCLDSIYEFAPKCTFEVVVVDNSKGGIKRGNRKYKNLSYVKSPGNVGYGAGNNLGASKAKGEYLLILNPDTEVLPNAIDNLILFLDEHKKAAIVAPNLVHPDLKVFSQLGTKTLTSLRGIIALSFLNKLLPNNLISRNYWLTDIPTNKIREVDVVPGSAFVIRKSVFDEVGGFDEKFFLYFEESDLCKRIKELKNNWQIYMIPSSEVIHYWEPVGKDQRLKEVFAQSRKYYFVKHFGKFASFLVELFANTSKWSMVVLLTFALGVFLRFFRIEENLVFHGELGHNYLAIKDFWFSGKIPLLGPQTSHPWLSFSPLFYWIFAPVLALWKFNPQAGAYFFAAIGSILVLENYFFVSSWFGRRVGLISSFLLSFSPSFLSLTRESRFFSLVVIFFYPFIYYILKRNLFWIGLFLGLMLSFHLTPLILLPAVFILIFTQRKSFSWKDYLKGFVGILIPGIPFILYNITTQFEMLGKFLIWIPYRILGFSGLTLKNNLGIRVVKSNILSLFEFFSKSYVFEPLWLGVLAAIGVLGYLIYLKDKLVYSKKTKVTKVFLLIFITSYFGIFVHGNPPNHYYLPIYPIPIVFLALFINSIFSKSKYLGVMILVLLFAFNLNYLFSSKWYFQPRSVISKVLIPFKMQLETARDIIAQARGKSFNLKRIGYSDEFEDDYAQNYIYLLWLNGNEPEDTETKLLFTIVEDGTIQIVKNEKR